MNLGRSLQFCVEEFRKKSEETFCLARSPQEVNAARPARHQFWRLFFMEILRVDYTEMTGLSSRLAYGKVTCFSGVSNR